MSGLAGRQDRASALWLLVAAAALLLVTVLATLSATRRAEREDSGLVWLRQALLLGAPSGVPMPVALPHRWTAPSPHADGTDQIYRLMLPPAAAGQHRPDALYALVVGRACNVMHVRLNGQLVHNGGRLVEPATRACHVPQIVAVPGALLHGDGTDTFDIIVHGYARNQVSSAARTGGLSAVAFGPYPSAAPLHARYEMLSIQLPTVLSGTLLLMGGFMFVLGWSDRRHSHLAYFGALMVVWSVSLAQGWWTDLPWRNHASEVLLAVTAALAAGAGVQFLLRRMGERSRRLNRLLALQPLLMGAVLFLAGPERLATWSGLWYLVLTAEVAWVAWRSLNRAQASRDPDFWPLVALLATLFGSEAVRLGAAPGALAPQWAALAPPLAFVVMGLRLVRRYGAAFQTTEQQRAELEEAVERARAETRATYEQMARLEMAQVTDRERKRIAADLHDDLGAKLLTIVHTSESERIATLAREALEEMRLSVRGLTGRPVRLSDALGDWRAEVMGRLAQAGIQGEWHAPADDDAPQTLSSRAYVQTTRILREAISNIIKHSEASQCGVVCDIGERDFHLVIQDNGRGIPTESEGRLDKGHGMASMKGRAKQLQGQCLVESSPGYGTVIRLTLPLAEHLTAH